MYHVKRDKQYNGGQKNIYDKRLNNDIQHKPGGDPGCSRRVSSFCSASNTHREIEHSSWPGADPGFQVRGGANIFGVFRVKITILHQKTLFFSNFRGAPRPRLVSII